MQFGINLVTYISNIQSTFLKYKKGGRLIIVLIFARIG